MAEIIVRSRNALTNAHARMQSILLILYVIQVQEMVFNVTLPTSDLHIRAVSRGIYKSEAGIVTL
jgi:hypothetical protein